MGARKKEETLVEHNRILYAKVIGNCFRGIKMRNVFTIMFYYFYFVYYMGLWRHLITVLIWDLDG